MNKKQEKLAFPHGGKSKFSKNQLSLARENQNSTKTSFPSRGKTRKQRKLAFPHGGKSKFSENQLFLMRENKKTAKNGFPLRGKTK